MELQCSRRAASLQWHIIDKDGVVAALRAAGCVFAEAEADLLLTAAQSPAHVAELVARRVTGEPLEYVLGWAEFFGLRIAVAPGVFVPRRRTELLVTEALRERAYTVVDLCCGAGALGAAVASRSPGAVYAADIDPAAVDCARRNLAPYGGVAVVGDLFAPLPAELRGDVDLLLVNAPYVPTAEIAFLPPEAREHEPLATLDGGPDGLDVLRRVIAECPNWLAPLGRLLFEVNERQTAAAVAAVTAQALDVRTVVDDGTCVVVARQPSRLST